MHFNVISVEKGATANDEENAQTHFQHSFLLCRSGADSVVRISGRKPEPNLFLSLRSQVGLRRHCGVELSEAAKAFFDYMVSADAADLIAKAGAVPAVLAEAEAKTEPATEGVK